MSMMLQVQSKIMRCARCNTALNSVIYVMQAVEGRVASVLDWNKEPELASSSQQSKKQSKQMSSILDWDDEPEPQPADVRPDNWCLCLCKLPFCL